MCNYITKLEYDSLVKSKEKGEYNNHICNANCGLGKTKIFKVKDTALKIEMKCTQIGGMFSGTHCFILC